MHTILETDAFVLRSMPLGEANKTIDLFTKEFGMIRATAQGIRYVKSKLRYSLTDFSISRVSLVRGREFWRIITATKKADITSEITSLEARESLFRIFALLRRLLQGEESQVELFEVVSKMFVVLKDLSNQYPADFLVKVGAVEEITVLRILFLLGYVKDDPTLRTFIENSDLDEHILNHSFTSRKVVVSEINRALKASHL